jgi:outer membrane receptor for ferrienterochelin and colicin
MKKIILPIMLLWLTISLIVAQENNAIMDSIYTMSIEELMNTKVTIATKSEQLINQTPSIVSVITSEEIKNMGARELEDILQTIPGFELSKRYGGEYGLGVRGVKDSRNTSKLLILIDGVPYNQIFYGNSIVQGNDIILDVIDRIEIIRGPGSALYGRNAFSGVINIISKTGKRSEKLYAKATLGEFYTKAISTYYSNKSNNLDAIIAVKRSYTDGTDTKFDNGFGGVSQWNIFRDNLSLNTNINYGSFSFHGMFYNLKSGAYFTNTNILGRTGYYSLSYNKEISPKISIMVRTFGHNQKYYEDIEQLKPEIDTAYPSGIYFKPQVKEYQYGIEAESNIKTSSNNSLLFGIQSDIHSVYDVAISSNFDFNTGSRIGNLNRENQKIYQPGWFDNNSHKYNNFAIFIQNMWFPFKRIGLTIGGRYDIDSQIGGILNPRLGLVIEPLKNLNIKFLYGKAYRAPSPSEQYQTIGYAFGNKDLKPEIINTYEISISHRYGNINNQVNFYNNSLSNIIYAATINSINSNNTYYNIGKNNSKGIELDNKIMVNNNLYTYLNYSYSISKNTDTISGFKKEYDQADVSPHKINMGVNYLFHKKFNININSFYRSKMIKFKAPDPTTNELTDVKDNIGNYIIFNASLRIENIIKNLYFNISVYNIFDKKYYSQDNEHLNQPPQPGKQISVSLAYSFK